MSLGWEEYEEERDYQWNLQTPEFVTSFEAQTWRVAVDLGQFPDEKFFLRLVVLSGEVPLRLTITGEGWDEADHPIHLTLGYPLSGAVDKSWLENLVEGEYVLKLKMEWTAREQYLLTNRGITRVV